MQWLKAPSAGEEFLGSSPTATTLSSLPRHEMTSAVNVALNTQPTNLVYINGTCVMQKLYKRVVKFI